MSRVARFRRNGRAEWGIEQGGQLAPVGTGAESFEFLIRSHLGAPQPQKDVTLVPLESVRLLAPIECPSQFLGIGLNYVDHARESGMPVPVEPMMFGFLPNAVIGDRDVIRLPPFAQCVDWEAELAIVIGQGGSDISISEALHHVAGYTIVNDISERDVQSSESQWCRAKSFDTFKPMGPWITTVDELGDADNLRISLWVNDELKQASSTSNLIFGVRELVSLISRSLTLMPGSVISTGTPFGVGFSRNPPEFLQAGDTVAVEIEGIGRLTNRVEESVLPAGSATDIGTEAGR